MNEHTIDGLPDQLRTALKTPEDIEEVSRIYHQVGTYYTNTSEMRSSVRVDPNDPGSYAFVVHNFPKTLTRTVVLALRYYVTDKAFVNIVFMGTKKRLISVTFNLRCHDSVQRRLALPAPGDVPYSDEAFSLNLEGFDDTIERSAVELIIHDAYHMHANPEALEYDCTIYEGNISVSLGGYHSLALDELDQLFSKHNMIRDCAISCQGGNTDVPSNLMLSMRIDRRKLGLGNRINRSILGAKRARQEDGNDDMNANKRQTKAV